MDFLFAILQAFLPSPRPAMGEMILVERSRDGLPEVFVFGQWRYQATFIQPDRAWYVNVPWDPVDIQSYYVVTAAGVRLVIACDRITDMWHLLSVLPPESDRSLN